MAILDEIGYTSDVRGPGVHCPRTHGALPGEHMTTSEAGPAVTAPAWVRRPANLGRAVTAELVERIVRGVHPPGTPLPPEPALCETFSVSRTVIREAMKVLQEKGLVQVRQGSGTVVTAP